MPVFFVAINKDSATPMQDAAEVMRENGLMPDGNVLTAISDKPQLHTFESLKKMDASEVKAAYEEIVEKYAESLKKFGFTNDQVNGYVDEAIKTKGIENQRSSIVSLQEEMGMGRELSVDENVLQSDEPNGTMQESGQSVSSDEPHLSNETETNSVIKDKKKAWDAIDEFREKTEGLNPLGDSVPTKGDGNGTVAYIELDGQQIQGVNSSLLTHGEKDLGRSFFAEIQQSGCFQNVSRYGQGNSQVFTHAEGHALIQAYRMSDGKLGSVVTIYVDRATCGVCQNNLPILKEYMGIEELIVVNKNGNIFKY